VLIRVMRRFDRWLGNHGQVTEVPPPSLSRHHVKLTFLFSCGPLSHPEESMQNATYPAINNARTVTGEALKLELLHSQSL
jgi:hypothetical protein